MRQGELSKWLKLIIMICALLGLFLCFIIPIIEWYDPNMLSFLSGLSWQLTFFIWITAIPFYVALINSWLICNEISHDNSFSIQNSKRLKTICFLALLESFLYISAIILSVFLNMFLPVFLIFSLFVIFIAISIAVAFATLSHLVQKACVLKQDSDLTI
ncbi:MAG: hypothetical protein K0R90_132 [Oscillospiraceae bacterium]|nr:hypothetical protein [Oscillospiraceae bacterium]